MQRNLHQVSKAKTNWHLRLVQMCLVLWSICYVYYSETQDVNKDILLLLYGNVFDILKLKPVLLVSNSETCCSLKDLNKDNVGCLLKVQQENLDETSIFGWAYKIVSVLHFCKGMICHSKFISFWIILLGFFPHLGWVRTLVNQCLLSAIENALLYIYIFFFWRPKSLY